MPKIDYTHLEKSLLRLKEQYNFYQSPALSALPANAQDGIRESVVKRFEICYDMLRQHSKKFLGSDGEGARTQKDVFRTLNKQLLKNQALLENLFNYVDARNATSHNYGEAVRDASFDCVADFIEDATEILKLLKAHNE